jgi:murein DD-endopeptidase MepM/ murein hydrolase activator NlpD
VINKTCAALPLCAIAIVSFSFIKKSKPSAGISESLVFPVAGRQSNIGSFWGDPRGDGGERKHEGIDIFAKRGTPVVAVADGKILSKNITPLGGKILWVQLKDKRWTAYYAHLDKQLVKEGEHVRKGQVIGTVGNTGNARTTPAHLHFGIYTWEGPVNPYGVVKNARKIMSPVLPDNKAGSLAQSMRKTEKPNGKKQYATKHSSSKQYAQKTRRNHAYRSTGLYVNNRSGVKNAAGKQYELARKWKKNSGKQFSCRNVPADKRKAFIYLDGK